MSEKISPLPWSLWGEPSPQQVIKSQEGFVANTLGGNDIANARFIVTAVNSHAALCEAFERALEIAKDIDCVSRETVYCFVDDAEKLLALVKGEAK